MQCLWEELLGGGDSPSKGSEVETVCSKEASEAETERVRWEMQSQRWGGEVEGVVGHYNGIGVTLREMGSC